MIDNTFRHVFRAVSFHRSIPCAKSIGNEQSPVKQRRRQDRRLAAYAASKVCCRFLNFRFGCGGGGGVACA
jgi:hypothetical protein